MIVVSPSVGIPTPPVELIGISLNYLFAKVNVCSTFLVCTVLVETFYGHLVKTIFYFVNHFSSNKIYMILVQVTGQLISAFGFAT